VNRKHDSGLSAAARFVLSSRGLDADPLLCRELFQHASRNSVTDEQVHIFAGYLGSAAICHQHGTLFLLKPIAAWPLRAKLVKTPPPACASLVTFKNRSFTPWSSKDPDPPGVYKHATSGHRRRHAGVDARTRHALNQPVLLSIARRKKPETAKRICRRLRPYPSSGSHF